MIVLTKYAVQPIQRTAVQNAQSIHHTFHLQCVAILCTHTYLALECLTLGIPHTKLHTKFEVSVAQVVFEILRSERIGVTSLTFQGHVTSSVT